MTFQDKIKKAKGLIEEYIEKYPRYGIACSWGKDSMVLLDFFMEKVSSKKPKVFSVLSDTEFQATLNLRDKIIGKGYIEYQEFIFAQNGSRDDCCRAPKVEKFKQALANYDCWFSGLRRDEGATRNEVDYVVNPDRFGKVKVNPLLDFTEIEIWKYLAVNQIPVNQKYKDGYRSLGCKNCSSLPLNDQEMERAGRWKGIFDRSE